MKYFLFIAIAALTACDCACNWKFEKGDVVEQKLVKGLLVVQDTVTINGEKSYRLISGTGSRRTIEEYKLYRVSLDQIH
jgi:hypothetical protein